MKEEKDRPDSIQEAMAWAGALAVISPCGLLIYWAVHTPTELRLPVWLAACSGIIAILSLAGLLWLRQWRTAIATGLLLGATASAAYWFIPDSQGSSRFFAKRDILRRRNVLDTIEPDATERFRTAVSASRTLERVYPEYTYTLDPPKLIWFARTVDHVVSQSEPWLQREPRHALNARCDLLSRLRSFEMSPDREQAIERTLHACLEAAKTEALGHLRNDQYGEAVRCATEFRDSVKASLSTLQLAALEQFVESLAFLQDLDRLAAPSRKIKTTPR
jgi:hypothetical protein